MSELYRRSATIEEHILEAERMIAMKPARRARSSSPGREMSVTDALRMTAAYEAFEVIRYENTGKGNVALTIKQAQLPMTSIGPAELGREPLSGSPRW